jgi:hypothetical protein
MDLLSRMNSAMAYIEENLRMTLIIAKLQK